jgi:predicted MFS family arabinose efflux permease
MSPVERRSSNYAASMIEAQADRRDQDAPVSRRLVALLAITAGTAVANLYYAQPLLHTLGRALSVSDGTAGLLVTIAQLGYVIGLALLVPLGDLLERRRLIVTMLLVVTCAQAVAAAAPSFAVFGAALGIACLASVVAQVIVPMSSSIAAEHERGQVVGAVMSGLLIGILLARTASGVIAGVFGWRAVFVFASASMLVLALVLRRALPKDPPSEELPYRELLGSVIALVREEPVLRQRMGVGAAIFGCFSVLWTSLAFLLSAAPYNYGDVVIGLFGLAGVAGALAASAAGRLADRGKGPVATTAALVTLLASWGLLAAGKSSVIALIIGIAVLDLAAQGAHIANQSAIYTLAPEARSRLTTAYMVVYFLGGAIFSALASTLYSGGGWGGICVLGAATAALSLAIWGVTDMRLRAGGGGRELAAGAVER